MLDKLQTLIISEIGDFTAGLGHPGEPATPEKIHSELISRIENVFADMNNQYCVNEVKAQAVSEVLKHFSSKFRPDEKLSVMGICMMLNNHVGYLLQQAKAGAGQAKIGNR